MKQYFFGCHPSRLQVQNPKVDSFTETVNSLRFRSCVTHKRVIAIIVALRACVQVLVITSGLRLSRFSFLRVSVYVYALVHAYLSPSNGLQGCSLAHMRPTIYVYKRFAMIPFSQVLKYVCVL